MEERIPEGRRVEVGKGSYKGVWGDQEDDYTWPSMKKHEGRAFEPTGRADAAELVPPGAMKRSRSQSAARSSSRRTSRWSKEELLDMSLDEYAKAGDPMAYKPGDQEGKTWYRKDRREHDEESSKKSDHKASSHEEENEDTTGCTTLVINGLFTIGERELWSS